MGYRNINEKCAVIAISNSKDFDVARLAYLGLWSMQHRGQDSSGIASYDGIKIHIHKRSGLVSNVYNDEALANLRGRIAIGHNRYATTGGQQESFNQPYEQIDINFAFAHNGNIPHLDKLKNYAILNKLSISGLNDSGLMGLALANELRKHNDIVMAVKLCWPLFTGAFSCVGLFKDKVFAFRDDHGIRPLSIAKSDHGYLVSSETVAADIIGADFYRDVEPGELIILKDDQIESFKKIQGPQKIDAFEFVYLARPDSVISGISVYDSRHKMGETLAQSTTTKADIVIGVPDSGLPAAIGFSKVSGIPYELGLLKNRYIGRTFIEPEKIRKSSLELKFNLIPGIVNGKDIVLIDDSLVRGNTLKHIIKILKSHGAKDIHVRIASPPVKFPDFYGIDTPKVNDLIAAEYTNEQILTIIGADSLDFISIDGLVSSIGLPIKQLCLSSFNGIYPISVPKISQI